MYVFHNSYFIFYLPYLLINTFSVQGLANLHRLAKAEFKEQTSSNQGMEQSDVIEKIRHLEDSATAGQKEASLRTGRNSAYTEYDVLSSMTDDEFDEYSRLGETRATFAISGQDEY